MPSVQISKVTVEHYEPGAAVDYPRPRISWRFSGDAQDWYQKSYELQVNRDSTGTETYKIDSDQSVLVDWPGEPLKSREAVHLKVRAHGTDGTTDWAESSFEAAFFDTSEWQAEWITSEEQAEDQPNRPFTVKQMFNVQKTGGRAKLYITALGVYEVEINGKKVGKEVLAPGWRTYKHYLEYQVHDVSALLQEGENVIVVDVAEGWYSGRLGFRGGRRNIYGTRPALLAQLEIDGKIATATDDRWQWSYGPIVSAELYDGEVFDSRLLGQESEGAWKPAETIPAPSAKLVVSEKPPVRETETIPARSLHKSPAGKTLLDFGVNLVGYLRFERIPDLPAGSKITVRHAEVLEHGELGTRPLRACKATDTLILGGKLETWQPRFTFHGFRYIEVEGFDDLKKEDLVAICVHTDMEATGKFETNHLMVNQLWKNVTRSMKGNFVSIPTDCPQRDERLGWTGDLNVFARTASFLYDTSGTLRAWLKDMAADQADEGGIVPVVVPNILQPHGPEKPIAIWGDVAVSLPNDIRDAFGDDQVVKDQWDSLKSWLDEGVKYGENGLWTIKGDQLGDWLDPAARPERAGDSNTDPYLVADAWLVHSLDIARKLAQIADSKDTSRYEKQYARAKATFQREYVTPAGRLTGDTQTGLALALRFGLLDEKATKVVATRLAYLVRRKVFQVCTGFAGTPIVLQTLAENGLLPLAYRMLLEKGCPSWLYPVSMGATSIWERWDSMLPDGSINPGEMTSFNHYALGAVADFMHTVIGGIGPLSPGWKDILVAPQPQPGSPITSASVEHISPYGSIKCAWKIEDSQLQVEVEVPPGSNAVIRLPGRPDQKVGSGRRALQVEWEVKESEWPPKAVQGFCERPPMDEYAQANEQGSG